jgi:threonine aldolase
LVRNNFVQADGYGNDEWCMQATQAIKKQFGNDAVDIHYVS